MTTSTIKIIMSYPIARKMFSDTTARRCNLCHCVLQQKYDWFQCVNGCTDGQWIHESDLKAYYK